MRHPEDFPLKDRCILLGSLIGTMLGLGLLLCGLFCILRSLFVLAEHLFLQKTLPENPDGCIQFFSCLFIMVIGFVLTEGSYYVALKRSEAKRDFNPKE